MQNRHLQCISIMRGCCPNMAFVHTYCTRSIHTAESQTAVIGTLEVFQAMTILSVTACIESLQSGPIIPM